ncbi:hypothetical protein A9Q84_03350 [Halobacteriovorax marinus]|uniref:Uncharacterized protein n=1 Tax=Halobacteriovorax marinus TaxID=97084 RepID=A0A1Y5F9W9_9BACT|nr:hypothetical protein A9Q84_03350 [Halobacteriovorax marinus]
MRTQKLLVVLFATVCSIAVNAKQFNCNYVKKTDTLTRVTKYTVSFNNFGMMTVDTVLDSKRILADGTAKDMLLETSISAFPTVETKKKTVNGEVVMDAFVYSISGRYDYKLVKNKTNLNSSLIVSRTRIKDTTVAGQMTSHSVPKSGGKTVVRVNCSESL